MSAHDPLTSRCPALCKSTRKQCRKWVRGGGVCRVHGGTAPQVKAKREQRVLVAEARASVPATVVMREPEEILITALHDVDNVLQQIKADLHGGSVNPVLLDLAGDWLDRVARIGKVVVDGELSEKLHRRMGWMAQDLAAQLTAMLAAVLQAAPLTAQQRLAVWESRFDGLRLVADGQAPAAMLNDATVRFTDELKVAAAREEALAEGLPWDELKPDAGGVDASLVVSGSDGNGYCG